MNEREMTRTTIYALFWNWHREGRWMHPTAFRSHLKGDRGYSITTIEHFNMVFGRPHDCDEVNLLTDREREICRNLLGSHGYTYYRGLLATRDEHGTT